MIHDSFEAFCISKYNYITVRPKARWAGLIYRTHQLPPPVTIKHRVVKFREISRTMDEKTSRKGGFYLQVKVYIAPQFVKTGQRRYLAR